MSPKYILEKATVWYKCLFIIAMLVSAVPYLHEIISPYIRIVLGIGILLLAGYAVFNRRLWKTRFLWILLAFAGAYLVTILANREQYLTENLKAWLYMLVIFLLLYGYDVGKNRLDRRKEMTLVLHTFLIGVFVLSLICLLTFIFSVKVSYEVNGSYMYIGMYDNRLWGLYNPNTGGALNATAMILSLAFLLEGEGGRGRKIFYAVNLFLQGSCLVLTSSRASVCAAVILVAVMTGIYVSARRKDNKRRILLGAAAGLLTAVLLAGGGMILKEGLSYVPSMMQEETPKKTNLVRKERQEARKGGSLTGRGDLWNAGWEGFLEAPVLGSGREGLYDRCEKHLQDPEWKASLYDGGLHNILLTVLVSSGAVGFGILTVFVVLTVRDILRYGVLQKHFGKDFLFLGNVMVLAAFGAMEMMEARILYRVGIFYVFFWMVYGYVMYDVQKEEEKE